MQFSPVAPTRKGELMPTGNVKAQFLRRKHRRQSTSNGTWIGRRKLIEDQNGICNACGWPIRYRKKRTSQDHVVPLVHGGTHTRENEQALHTVCNNLKGDDMPTPEMLERQAQALERSKIREAKEAKLKEERRRLESEHS